MKVVLIKGGHLIDPSQNISSVQDLILVNGKISSTIPDNYDNLETINATGLTVAPGFIDIHMHEDSLVNCGKVENKSIARAMARMGVTTAIGGNCGVNYIEPFEFLNRIDEHGTAINMGLFVGHNYLRNLTGDINKYDPLTEEQIDKLLNLLQKQLDAGCFGISFAPKYSPGITKDELYQSAKLCVPNNKIITSHVRYDADKVFEATRELADLGLELGIPVQNSHIGSMGGYGQMKDLLSMLEEYRNKGLDIMSDCYPYYSFSTGIGETTYDEGFLKTYNADYSAVQICEGKYKNMRCTKEIFDELRATTPETITVGHFMKSEDVDMALLDHNVILASDGLFNDDQGHPRAAGTFPRFINNYVKTGKISIEEAIAKMTTKQAQRLGLNDKGNLKSGSDGDIVIFSLNEIEDQATFDEPATPPKGIHYVLINGEIAVKNNVVINDCLGKAVRDK